MAPAAAPLTVGDGDPAASLPGAFAPEDLVLLAGEDAPDDPDTAGLVVTGATGVCTGDSVTGVVAGTSDAEADAGSAGELAGGVGPVHCLSLSR